MGFWNEKTRTRSEVSEAESWGFGGLREQSPLRKNFDFEYVIMLKTEICVSVTLGVFHFSTIVPFPMI